MTTAAAQALYEKQHIQKHYGLAVEVFNPHGKPLSELPIIFGFNNGGGGAFWHAELIAQDGTHLGSHICSSEAYMPSDLGVLQGTGPDRHVGFRQHYPDGYKMEFVGAADIDNHALFMAVIQANINGAKQ